MRSTRPRLAAFTAAVAAATAITLILPPAASAVAVGAGSYATERPAGAAGPSNSDGAPVTPKVTARMAGQPVPTNEVVGGGPPSGASCSANASLRS